ncbi:diguanylate cyclase, partial [Paracoccus sp. S4493]
TIGVALVTEEALVAADEGLLQQALADQPSWSDVPFIVLANGTSRHRSDRAKARIDALQNGVVLSRPLHAEELVRAVRSALKARARQYEARDRMHELQTREAQLHDSEAKFHAIADSVDQMIWSTRPDGFH